jgi:hypothetical protein
MGTSESRLSQDLVFDILSSPRRRYVLYYLRQSGEPVELTTLAEHVAAWENDTTVEELTEQERKRVYVSLYQTHVPKLDEANIVKYDQETGEVGLAAGARQVDEYLGQPSEEFPWQQLYLVLAGVTTLILALTVLDVFFFEALAEGTVALVAIAVFIVTAVVHYVSNRAERAEAPPELQRRQ